MHTTWPSTSPSTSHIAPSHHISPPPRYKKYRHVDVRITSADFAEQLARSRTPHNVGIGRFLLSEDPRSSMRICHEQGV